MDQEQSVIPLTPQDALANFYKEIPNKVIECWNECISENLSVRGKNVSSHFFLADISEKVMKKMSCTHEEAHKKGWFDLEDVFRKQGWKVKYDQPAYNESYKAFFEFSNKNND
jgi:hypothetical protein